MGRLRGFAAGMLVALSLGALGCGGAEGSVNSADANSSGDSNSGNTTSNSGGVQRRLQGTWKVERYVAEPPVPDEATPVMDKMFQALRIQFEGNTAIVSTGSGSTERTQFEISNESGDEFTLKMNGGIFDGARCKMQGDDSWEAVVRMGTWPGTSVLRRVEKP